MNQNEPKPIAHEREPTGKPTIEIDFDYYARYLKDYNVTEDQKRELISTIAALMMAFVDLGFGVSPTQSICRDDEIFEENPPPDFGDMLCSYHSLIAKCERDTAECTAVEMEES